MESMLGRYVVFEYASDELKETRGEYYPVAVVEQEEDARTLTKNNKSRFYSEQYTWTTVDKKRSDIYQAAKETYKGTKRDCFKS